MDRKHLRQHRGRWYLNLRVPTDLVEHYGRSHLVRSLGTDSLKVARRRRDEALTELHETFASLRGDAAEWRPPPGWLDPIGVARHARAEIEAGRSTEADALEALDENAFWNAQSHDPQHLTLPANYPDPRRLRDIVEGRAGIALSAAVERYVEALGRRVVPSTVATRRTRLEALVDALGDPLLADVTRAQLAEHLQGLDGAAGTRRNRAAAITAFFTWAIDAGLLQATPADRLTRLVRDSSRGVEATARRAWTPAEVRRLLQHVGELPARDPMRVLVPLLAFSGLRREEACNLTDRDVEDACFVVRAAKNRNSLRKVPIHSRLLPLVEGARGHLVPGLKPAGLDGKRGREAGNRFRRQKIKWGFGDDLVLHGLRASVAQQMRDGGVAEDIIGAILGHAPQSVTFRHYAKHASMAAMREAVEKVEYGIDHL